MNKPYKIEMQYLYTEVVYYDADGAEMGRDKRNDPHLWDSSPHYELTDEEIVDWVDPTWGDDNA